MTYDENTPRNSRTIAGLKLTVPAPYAEGQAITAAEAQMLNQTVAENFSNNLRKRIEGFVPAGSPEGTEPRLASLEEAQAIVDAYAAVYSPGVRQGGGGGRTSLTPVEREVKAIATNKIAEFLKSRNQKRADVDFPALVAKLIEVHGEALTRMAEKIVAARDKATGGDDADMLASVADSLG